MKKIALSMTLLSVAVVSAYLPQDEAKINDMKGRLSQSEKQIPVKHKEIAEVRETISRKAATDNILEKDSRQELPASEVEKNAELKAKLESCEAGRDRLLKDIAKIREDIARETAAADVREKNSKGAVA